MSIVLRRDFQELRRTNAFRILVLTSAVITIGIAVGTSIALSKIEWLGVEAAKPMLELIMGLVIYFLPFSVLISFIWAFASLPITIEKVNGNIESLLATPLSPKAIWMGKGLAIFLPGFVISIVSTLIVLLAVNFAAIIPATGDFFLPAPVLLTGLLFNPLLFFGLLSFIVLFSLANNPDIAIMPSFLLGFGLMIGIPVGIAIGAIDLASWSFALWYLAGTIVVWAVVGYLSRLLTKEQIVLSSKGG
jgi:ABC-type transport system involved in multi-copper enzyme maturation permease subunit